MITEEQKLLASKITYFYPARFISGRIMEYDIKAANISMLRSANLLNDDFYRFLLTANKQYREEFIGWQIKKEKEESGSRSALEGSITYRTIYNGIRDAKIKLFELNNIQPNEVINIANDAVFINRSSNLDFTKINDFVEFKLKMIAESVIKLSTTLYIYFWHDNNGLNLEVKGIGEDNIVALHQPYMLSFIGSVLLTYERAGITDAIHLIEDFYNDYVNRRLDKNFYRELSPSSMYKVVNSGYYLYDIENINLLDISYNGNLIRELWKIMISKLQSK